MFEKTTLPNGLRIVSCTMPETRSVSINILVGAGSRYEPDEEAGVSHFLEHMLFKGTDRFRSAKEVAEKIEGVGGYMNAATDKESTVYWCRLPAPHFDTAFDVMADVLQHSRFEHKDFEKERQVILEELKSTDDMPMQRADFMIDEMVWPGHPMGRDVGGSKDTVRAMKRETAVEYLKEQYVPNNMVVAIAGNVTHKHIVDTVGKHMGRMKPGKTRNFAPAKDGQKKPAVQYEERKTEQAHFCVGLRALSAKSPDRHALDLMNVILGEGMSSRLFQKLREQMGLAYDVSSGISHFQDTGSMVVYAGVDPKKVTSALKGVLGQLKAIKKPITRQEVTRAKELSKGRTFMRMEDTRAVSSWMGYQELLLGRIRTVDEVASMIDKVSIDQMQDIAEKLLLHYKLNLAVVGPHSQEKHLQAVVDDVSL